MSIVVDVGYGAHKQAGTVGIDCRVFCEVHVACNFERGLPFKDGRIASAYSIHSIEHLRDVSRVSFPPAYFQKRCRRYLWNVCEEMTVILETVKP